MQYWWVLYYLLWYTMYAWIGSNSKRWLPSRCAPDRGGRQKNKLSQHPLIFTGIPRSPRGSWSVYKQTPHYTADVVVFPIVLELGVWRWVFPYGFNGAVATFGVYCHTGVRRFAFYMYSGSFWYFNSRPRLPESLQPRHCGYRCLLSVVQ